MILGIYSSKRVFIKNKEIDPKRSQDVYNHSPDGFNWGYGGSGPAQLALAILLEFSDEDTAKRLYQDFKWKFVAELPRRDFALPGKKVKRWIKEKKGIIKEGGRGHEDNQTQNKKFVWN